MLQRPEKKKKGFDADALFKKETESQAINKDKLDFEKKPSSSCGAPTDEDGNIDLNTGHSGCEVN